jgi:hypothetical protein
MDPILAAKLIELAIVGIQGGFTLMAMAGKTEAEIDDIYLEEKRKFVENNPDLLPDV